ncbi:MAG: HD domain-containing protein [Bacteroidetes bacterium]|jgi:HD superfamily phosphohydrolase|nr:HD domain-containing protein [Bacteroidota bacterium]
MNKKKIVNDPVYGFITIPYNIVFDLVEHPFVQRLRRIKQVSLTHYVYPGALHTRFHHALGALHLMGQAIEVLRSKEVEISDEEAKAASIAILLHDIGHGPFSHTLEHTLINVHHEELSLLFMECLNDIFENQLDLAIQIFKNKYHKKFLHQLISGQLDMDRMDYLNRDSFFTGVHEGVIGYDRIIKMLAVHNDELVVEEKGIYSIEKFLIARRLMYWQVYLHKTVLGVEQMLIRVWQRAKKLVKEGAHLEVSKSLQFFLFNDLTIKDFGNNRDELINHFSKLDDYDIVSSLKNFTEHEDPILSFLSKSIINRKLFKVELKNEPFSEEYIGNIRHKVSERFNISEALILYLVFQGSESNRTYNTARDEIKILYKNGEVKPMSESSDYGLRSTLVKKYYLCYPKGVV